MPKRQVVTQRLLLRLILAQGSVVPDAALLAATGCRTMSTLHTLVCRLRQRLRRPAAIERIRGVWFCLDPAATPDLPSVDARLLVPAEPAVKRG